MAQQYFSNRDNTDSLPKKAKIIYVSKKKKPELTKKEQATLSKGAKKLQEIVNHRRKIRDERKTPILSLDQMVKRKQLIDKLNKKNGFNVTESALDNVLQKPAVALPAIMPAVMPTPAMLNALRDYLKPQKQQQSLQTPQKQKNPRGRPLKLKVVELKTPEDERIERLRRYNPKDLRNIAIHYNVNVRKNAIHENVIKAVIKHEKANNLRLDVINLLM